MKNSRYLFLGLAVCAGILAWMLSGSDAPPPPPVAVNIEAPEPRQELEEVLAASRPITIGVGLTDEDMNWIQWPRSAVADGMIVRSKTPDATQELKGAISRSAIYAGEPMRREKLVKGATAGFMSAILPAGSRAIAINIDTQGSTSAGGFILPNDRVDILQVGRDEDAAKGGGEGMVTNTILQNIRVLAIGQNVQEKNGEKVVVGSTATLEANVRQAEILALAQRQGQLTLVLRSIYDSKPEAQESTTRDSNSFTIVRFGVVSTVGRR